MFDDLGAPDLILRLGCALLAGGVLGFDRGERGKAAGVRTMMLVCLAAATAMIQATMWMGMEGRSDDSFVRIDVLRFPLGILTGIGFIGAGVIVKRGDLISGVSTAAAIWLATIVGLCIGGGQIGLGLSTTALGFVVLALFKRIDARFKREQHADLSFVGSEAAPDEAEVRSIIETAGYEIETCSACYSEARRELDCIVKWRSAEKAAPAPTFVRTLAARPGVLEVAWRPRPHAAH